MTKYEKIKKELEYLYEAKKILQKYDINSKSIDKRIDIYERNLKLFLWRDKK